MYRSETPTEFVVADLQAEYRRIQNSWVQHYGLQLRYLTSEQADVVQVRRYLGTRLVSVTNHNVFNRHHWTALNETRMPVEQLGQPGEEAVVEVSESVRRERAMQQLAERERAQEVAAGSPMPAPEGHQEEEDEQKV